MLFTSLYRSGPKGKTVPRAASCRTQDPGHSFPYTDLPAGE